MDFLKEMFDAWAERLRTPLIGSIIISFFALNWRSVWILLFSDEPIRSKFLYVDSNTSVWTIFIGPLFMGAILALLLPWIKFLGAFLAQYPAQKLRKLQSDSASNHRIYRMVKARQEEEAREAMSAAREEAAIARARRLQSAEDVGGTALKEDLQSARDQESDLSHLDRKKELGDVSISLLKDIARSNKGTYRLSDFEGSYKIFIGNEVVSIPNREKFLQIRSSLDLLRKFNLIEPDSDAVSKVGYEFLSWLDNDALH